MRNNFEISNIQELNYIKIENSKKNDSNNINKIFEINKINDICFEKDKKVKSFSQNLSMDNIFDFKIIQRIKRKNAFESENLFMETAEDFEYIIFKLINLEISEQIMLTFLKDKLNLSSNRTNNINKSNNREISNSNITSDYKKIPKKENSEQNFIINKSDNIHNTNSNIDKSQLNLKEKKLEEIKEEKSDEKNEEKKELNLKKDEKSEKINRAINRIRRKNQSIISDSNIINSEEFQDLRSTRTRVRSDTVNYGKSGKILNIAKKLELQMNKGDDNDNQNIEPKKNENQNSNLVGVISKQPIIKKKKKKSKINFEFEA